MEFIESTLSAASTDVIYGAIVIFIAVLALYIGLKKLKAAEKERLESISHMEVSEPVETEASDEDAERIIRRRASSSVKLRFEFIRKAYIPFVVGVAGVLIALPLLPTLSASYISLAAGVAAVLVGIAGRPFIENAISGIVITLSQPLCINDTVIIDRQYGTVEKITLLYTVIKVWNWRRYVIPNYKLLQKEFENLTQGEESEWAHFDFRVAPGSDLERVRTLAKESMQCKYLDDTEPPSFWVMELSRDSILCWVAGWARSPREGWALRSRARRALAKSLTEEGIDFALLNNRVSWKTTEWSAESPVPPVKPC